VNQARSFEGEYHLLPDSSKTGCREANTSLIMEIIENTKELSRR
jgi:hypothetical protein